MEQIDPKKIKCVVFDFGFTLSSEHYFKVSPPNCPNWHDVIQEHIFADRQITNPWMKGSLTLSDIADVVAGKTGLKPALVVEIMEKGCEDLRFNEAVHQFALAQRGQGRKTALVTANMDVFTKVVVPSLGLNKIFDIILNTSDYKELRKEVLWEIAFVQLGNGIGYENSLLIEDGSKEPEKFRERGGYAHQYHTDELLTQWLNSSGFKMA